MDINRDLIYLAALIHDIGKFSQRADSGSHHQSDFIPHRIKDMISSICPKDKQKNKHTHTHALYTAAFIENHRKIFQRFISAEKSQISDLDTFIKLAASHHDPYSYFERLIQKAGHYSSGSDRVEKEGLTEEEGEKGYMAYKKTRMVSIFEGICRDTPKYQYRLPVHSIDFDPSAWFPRMEFQENPGYKTLWEHFEKDLSLIDSDHPRIYAETLLQILQKHTVNVPASTMHLPDVSLYDHLKTTAAFAVCLYDFMQANGKDTIEKDDEPVLLVGGDLSGIQNFIYDIVSKYAAKNLKGRSFYLELLVNSVIKLILNELGLYAANIVYASGGGFYILAPNNNTIKEKLDHLEQTISRKIFKAHGESLYLALDYIPNSEQQILHKEIGSQWGDLIEKVNRKKRKKYRYELVDRYEEFFKPTGVGAEQTRDAITGEEILEDDSREYLVKEEDSIVKELTHDQIELGKKLKNTVFWLTTDTKIRKLKAFDPAYLGVYHYLLTKEDVKRIDWKHLRNNPFNEIRLINELDFQEKHIPTSNLVWGFEFYGGNNYPVFNEDMADSEGNIIHRAGESKSYQYFGGEGNFQRIGMLRMDVDNLGQIFASGLKDENRTYSRYSTLSRSLDYFFKGYLSRLWEKEAYHECSSIIYAGGDDLFIVGKWDTMIQMAEEIKDAFSHWTCYNPGVTLSGGIAVVPVKFPVMRGAKEAGSDEDSAKQHAVQTENGLMEKSAFTLFGYPLHWEKEYPIVKEYKDRIKAANEAKDGLAQSFYNRIYKYFEYAGIKQHEITNHKVLWMTAYEFGRLTKTVKSSHAKELLKDCQKGIYANSINGRKNLTSYHFLELLYVAAKWAELELRTYKH